MRKVHVVGTQTGYSRWIKNFELTNNIEEADIVMFTGGCDINPEIYGCKKHPSTYYDAKRDAFELEAFKKIRPDQFCIGTCRGAQLCCALYGGRLIQDVSNHSSYGTHKIINLNNNSDAYEITTIHHQMMYPFNMPKEHYSILYVTPNLSSYYKGDQIDIPPYDPEIILFHKKGMPTCLGIQGHPEMMRADAPVLNMLNKILDKYVSK